MIVNLQTKSWCHLLTWRGFLFLCS